MISFPQSREAGIRVVGVKFLAAKADFIKAAVRARRFIVLKREKCGLCCANFTTSVRRDMASLINLFPNVLHHTSMSLHATYERACELWSYKI